MSIDAELWEEYENDIFMLAVYENRENVSIGVKFEQNLFKGYKFVDLWN